MDEPSEADLVREALAGRTNAYAVLALRWGARIMAVCHARVSSPEVAEDLTQETLLRGFRALATLREPHKFGAWISGIARCISLDWLKAKERSQISLSDLGDVQHVVDADGPGRGRADGVERLVAEVESLPDAYREVIMLYYYGDQTYRDLADMLGVSAATVNARLTKARAMLRHRLAEVPSE